MNNLFTLACFPALWLLTPWMMIGTVPRRQSQHKQEDQSCSWITAVVDGTRTDLQYGIILVLNLSFHSWL